MTNIGDIKSGIALSPSELETLDPSTIAKSSDINQADEVSGQGYRELLIACPYCGTLVVVKKASEGDTYVECHSCGATFKI